MSFSQVGFEKICHQILYYGAR